MKGPLERPLRIGVLVDDTSVPAWVAKVLEQVAASSVAEVAVVIQNKAPRRRRSPLSGAWQQRRYLSYRLYSRLDRLFFPADPDPFRRIDILPLLGEAEVLEVLPRQTKHSDFFPENSIARMRELDLDVGLRFGFRILRGEVLTVPRHGIWSYHHDDNTRIRGGPPGFWEVLERHPVTGSVLQTLTERLDGGEVLCRSWSPTHRRSVNRNRAHVYWKSSEFVMRQLRRLHAEGSNKALDDTFLPYSSRLYRKPTNRALAPKLARLMFRASSSKLLELVGREHWHLAFSVDAGDDCRPPEFFRLREISPPNGRFWADPFPEKNGRGYLLFFEEYVERMKRGRICALELDEKGTVMGNSFPALQRPYHLSYPFTFRYKGSLFMVPESRANRSVEVYRCDGPPDSWTLEQTLFADVRAVDATLHQENDRWWLFVNMGNEEMTHLHDELYLFHAPSPFGPWVPHRHNPVISDARIARPAGRLFHWRGELLRPSQDCSLGYGSQLNFNRVLELSTTGYHEELRSRARPDWDRGLTGLHTYNRLDRLTVVDVRRRSGPLGRGRPRRNPTSSASASAE